VRQDRKEGRDQIYDVLGIPSRPALGVIMEPCAEQEQLEEISDMGKLYPDAVIADLLDRSNIVELVGSYVPLTRAGSKFKANCPFHPEKTASFIVSADKQIYHCFGCGVGGNAISFIMAYERVDFLDALETLARRCGITLPEPERSSFDRSRDDISKNIAGVNEKACACYHANLLNSKKALTARAYLAKRGIPKETAQKFRLGFATPEWDALISNLKNQGINLGLMEKSGLVVAKESGGYYDRFRNRIIFPIIDIKDRVIAFGARVLGDELPKYINSPETPLYIKGKHLFGLNIAKEEIRKLDAVIIVEGYLDMIVPFEAGIKNIAASLGTALTVDQIRLIKRFTQNIVMLYDADLAGQLATLRALELLIEEDLNVKIARLPEGEDPDTFVRRRGADAFRDMIAQAKPLFDFKFDFLLSRHESASLAGKEKIVKEILPTVKKFPSHIVRSEYIRLIAGTLSLDERALWEDFKDIQEAATSDEAAEHESAAVSHYKLREIPITERMLVKLMLDEMHLIDKLRSVIDPSDFMEEKLRKIVRFIFDFFCQGKECKPGVLMNYLDDEEAIGLIAELAALDIHDCPNKEKLISDCVGRLKRDKILYRCQELHKEIQIAQNSGDALNMEKLISEYNHLIKQRSMAHGEARS
jgi:DNA primase